MLREERKKMTFFSSLSLCLLRFKYEKKKKKKRIKVEKVSYQQQNTAKPNLPNKIKEEKKKKMNKENITLHCHRWCAFQKTCALSFGGRIGIRIPSAFWNMASTRECLYVHRIGNAYLPFSFLFLFLFCVWFRGAQFLLHIVTYRRACMTATLQPARKTYIHLYLPVEEKKREREKDHFQTLSKEA